MIEEEERPTRREGLIGEIVDTKEETCLNMLKPCFIATLSYDTQCRDSTPASAGEWRHKARESMRKMHFSRRGHSPDPGANRWEKASCWKSRTKVMTRSSRL